jgi:hypothetical protein
MENERTPNLHGSKSSATNGMITRNTNAVFSCNKNHSDLVKFGKHDQELSLIHRELKQMVKRAMARADGLPFITPLREGLEFSSRTKGSPGSMASSRVGTGL